MTHSEAIAQLRQLEQGARKAMQAGELKVANEIAEDAKLAAPGSLPSGIYVTQNETETVVVGGEDIAAYVEFGTGTMNVRANFSVFKNDPLIVNEAGKFIVS